MGLAETPVGNRLLDHYLRGSGEPLKLTKGEMLDTRPVLDVTKSAALRRAYQRLRKKGGGSEKIKFRALARARQRGTLGVFTGNYEGELKVSKSGKWMFEGDVSFYDKWDFDPKAWGAREPVTEAVVRALDAGMRGEGFEVRTPKLKVVQGSETQAWFEIGPQELSAIAPQSTSAHTYDVLQKTGTLAGGASAVWVTTALLGGSLWGDALAPEIVLGGAAAGGLIGRWIAPEPKDWDWEDNKGGRSR